MDEMTPLIEKREWHPAVSDEGCKAIWQRLKKMGLDLELIEAIDTGKGDLRFSCIFEGQDADPHADRWKSYYEVD